MTTKVDLDLDGSGFIKEFEQAARAVGKAEKNIVAFIDATRSLETNANGNQVQNITIRLEALNERGKSVIKTFEKIEGIMTLTDVKLKAVKDSTKKLADEQQKLIKNQAEAGQLKNLFAFNNADPARKQGSSAEKNRLNAAQNDLVRFAEAGKASAAQILDIYNKVITGTFQAGDASSRLLRLVLNLVDAENRQGRAAAQAADQSAKAKERQGKAVQKTIDALNKEIALEEQRAAIIAHNVSESNKVRSATRAPNQDLRTRGEGGKGTVDQIQAFLNAERALEKLAFKGKASFAEIEQAVLRARKGTLSLATATTDAERAALRLVSAERRIGQEAAVATNLFKKLADSVVNLGKITAIGILLGNLFRLQSALEDSIRTAIEFSVRIGQIQTVEDGPTFGTERWAESLRELSDAFGIPILNQAEAAYQTLSNQVAQGADAILFLEAANRLAVTGVTDTASAVETLTSVLKAYNKPVEDAELVSARLFRIAELGRVKIEELTSTFGRVTVPAALLGVSLEELGAGIAVTTVQGFRFEAASTLLRNIMLKLIRPTEDLKEFFKDIGVNSGEAAIQTFGFAGILQKLEERTRGSSTEIGELFHELRANTGIMSLIAGGTDGFAVALQKIRDTDVNAFMEDTNRILQTSGQQLKIAAEQAKNFFEVELGQKVIDASAAVLRSLGGVNNILTILGDNVQTLATIALPVLIVRLGAAAIAAVAYARTLDIAAVASARLGTTVALAGGPFAAIAATIGVVVVGSIELYRRVTLSALREAEAANLRLLNAQQDASRSVATFQRRQTEIQTTESERRNRLLLQEVANRRKSLSTQQNDLKKAAESIEREFGLVQKRFNSFLTKTINLQEKRFADARRAVEQSVEAIRDSLEAAVAKPLEFDLKIAGLGKRSAVLQTEIEELQAQASAAATSGDFDAFDRLRKQIEKLAETRLETEVDFAKERSRLGIEEREARKKLTEANTREEEDSANRAIDGIQRQRDLLRSGTQAQIELEKERQGIKEQIAQTDNSEEVEKLTKELAAVEDKQKDINKLVIEERNIRLEGLKSTKLMGEELLRINAINVQRAADAEAEAASLKAAQFSYSLLTKEAEDFKEKEVLAKDTAEEILPAISKQQELYARIIALQNKLGAGAEANQVVEQKAQNLQQQTQLKLEQLRADSDAARLDALKKQFDAQVNDVQSLTKLDQERIALAKQKLDELRQIGIFTSSRETEKGRGRRGFLDGTSVDTLMDRNVGEKFQSLLQLTQPLSLEAKSALGADIGKLDATVTTFVQAIQRQAKDPSQANTDLVNNLALEIDTFFARFEDGIAKAAVGSDETAREQARSLQLLFNEVKRLNEAADRIFVVNREIQAINTRHAELTGDAPRDTAKAISELPTADKLSPQESARLSLENLEKFNRERATREGAQAPGLPAIPNLQSVDEEVGATFGDGIRQGVSDNRQNFVEVGETAAESFATSLFSGSASKTMTDAAVRTAEIQARTYQEQQKLTAPDVAETVAQAQADAEERLAVLGLGTSNQGGPRVNAQGNLVTGLPDNRTNQGGFVSFDSKGNAFTRSTSLEDFRASNAKFNTPTPLDPKSPEGQALASILGQRQTAEQALLQVTGERKTADQALLEITKNRITAEEALADIAPRIFNQEIRPNVDENSLEFIKKQARFKNILRVGSAQIDTSGDSGAPVTINVNTTINEAQDGPTTAADIERILNRAERARIIERRKQ